MKLRAAALLLLACAAGAMPGVASRASDRSECALSKIDPDHDHSVARLHHGACGFRELGQLRVGDAGGLGSMDLHGDLLAVVGRDEGIVSLVDVSDPAHMEVLGRFDDGASDSLDGDVAFSDDGKWLFYARQTNQFSADGIHVLDVSDPAAPTRAFYQPQGGTLRVAYYRDEAGEWVVSLDAVDGLVINRFVPETGTLVPVWVDPDPLLKVGGPGSGGLVVDRKDAMDKKPYLYAATGKGGLDIFDISDPMNPELVDQWTEFGLGDIAVYTNPGDARADELAARTVFAVREYWFDKSTPPEVVTLDASGAAIGSDIHRISPTFRLQLPADDLWRVRGLGLRDDELYVAAAHAGLAAFDTDYEARYLDRYYGLSTGEPIEAAGLHGTPHSYDVLTRGRRIYLSDASTGVLTVLAR